MNGLLKLKVTYDGGRTEPVGAGQREMAEWEQQAFGCSALQALGSKPVLYLRFVAWAALKRSGNVPKSKPFAAWSEGVESVEFQDDEEEEPAGDPTKPDQ